MDRVDSFVAKATDAILDPLIALFIGISVLVFLFGLVRFLTNSTNSEERQIGVKHMIWGFVGFVIMYSAQGLLNFVQNTVESL